LSKIRLDGIKKEGKYIFNPGPVTYECCLKRTVQAVTLCYLDEKKLKTGHLITKYVACI
jgi:hypothetical protein